MTITLIVEDGSAKEEANTYVSLQEADEHIATFYGDSGWAELDEQSKKVKLVVATRFLDSLLAWESVIKSPKQALAWPRMDFHDREGRLVSQNSIPSLIREAQIDLAVSSIDSPLTTEFEKLLREDFGDTSDVYAAPVKRGGNPTVLALIKSLSYMQYGANRSSIIQLQRR